MTIAAAAILVSAGLAAVAHPARAGSDLIGRVVFSGSGVPGATVSATHAGRTIGTVSDEAGLFRFASLEDGAWTVRVEMRGFATAARDITTPFTGDPLTMTLAMRRYEEIVGRPAAPARTASVAEDAADAAALINGSVSNAAASPFAQPQAIGNNRPRQGPPYTGGLTALIGNSAWNARPDPFGAPTAAPAYADVELGFNIGGPLRIPRLVRNGPQTYLNYQRGLMHSATTQSAVMPTEAERTAIDRISPQSAALLAYYPLPNTETSTGANYQKALASATTQDALQLAMSKAITRQTTMSGTLAFQRTAIGSVSLFGFEDDSRQSSLKGTIEWTRRFNTRVQGRANYQFTRLSTTVTPFFADRLNVSEQAGINGNNQDPENWGPPALSFPDIAGLRDVDYQRSIATTHAAGGELQVKRGLHSLTAGGDLRRNADEVLSQSNPRGTLTFTGAATGTAFGDFLIGVPATSAIGFSDAGTRLRGTAYDAYFVDDWRVSTLTLNLGVRWEYEPPLTPALHPDRHGIQPRLAASWRPVAGSSLVVRAGYGVYRNLGVYQPLATLLAQQPPRARTFSVQNTVQAPLTLANPFPPSVPSAVTFTVDPHFRAGAAHTWQVSAQRDWPASLTTIVAYLGAAGRDLMQASLPHTYPAGAPDPCPECQSGYVAVTSNGSSLRNAAQFILRRRLHNGFTATLQYTLAKSTDDAATFSNTAVSPQSLTIAQDWRNLEAEHGPSPFDQRHAIAAQVQYTTGTGAGGGTLVDGVRGTLFKDWTIAGQLTAGSGLPFTPVAFVTVAGSGVVGVRPRLTGEPVAPLRSDAYANPAAYAAPFPGTWGNAGRNSIRGPSQAAFDASLSRVFRLRGRLNLEWRVAATNVLNHVTFASIATTIASPQFGLPTVANPMRRVRVTLRLRF